MSEQTKKQKALWRWLFASLMSTTALTGVAAAQTTGSASTQPAQSSADNANNNEIIVTATKRAENIQDIPLSIQALGAQTLNDHEVQSFDNYANLLPSVSFQSFGPGQAQIFFRGVSSGGDGLHIGSQPTSSMYVDDVPVTTVANTIDLHIYDISRVEALSGPQGTLFGASSLSGVVRVITNQPDPTHFAGGYSVEANTFTDGAPGGTAEGYLNIPLGHSAALRLVAFADHTGGYIDNVFGQRTYSLGDLDPGTNVTINNAGMVRNDFNDGDTYGGRAALRVDLNENWTSTTEVIGQSQLENGPFLFDPRVGDLQVHDFRPTRNADNWWLAAETIQGHISNYDLVYTGSYFDRYVDNQSDYSYYTVAYDNLAGSYYTYFPDGHGGFLDPTQRVVLGDHYTKESHELRVTSPEHDRLRFTAGVFYQRQRDDIAADYIIDGISGIPTPPTTVPLIGFGDSVFRTRIRRDDVDTAAYAEVSYDFAPQWTLTVGGRAFRTENTIEGFSGFESNAEAPNCLPTTATDRPCDNVNKTFHETGTTQKVSLQYHIDDDRMLYATYSTGYRPGGNNRRPGVNPYASDTITNYEIGWKTEWFDRHLRWNLSIFDQEWDNLQFGLTPVGSLGVVNTYNAGSAQIRGAETDFSWYSGPWALSGAATYIDAYLTSDFCQPDALGNPVCDPMTPPAAPSGTRLPTQPRLKLNATARYNFNLWSWEAFIQGAAMYQSGTRSFLTDADEAAVGPTRAFTTFDFSTGVNIHDTNVEFYVTNAFDERGILSRNAACAPTANLCGPYARSYPVQPRLVGVRVSRDF